MTSPDAAEHQSGGAPPGVKDFTVQRKAKSFYVAPDLFEAPGVLIVDTLKELGHLHARLSTAFPDGIGEGLTEQGLDDVLSLTEEMFRLFLPGENGERFAARLHDKANPIGVLDQALPILYWLLEEYGFGRPMVPSSVSPTGSTDAQTDIPSAGASSTAGASPAPSTSDGLTSSIGST